jgi:hypothetical protein
MLTIANYPALDRTPPVDSPEVQQWLSQIDLSGVPTYAPSTGDVRFQYIVRGDLTDISVRPTQELLPMVDVGGLVVDVVSPFVLGTQVCADPKPVKPISSIALMSALGELHTMMDHPLTLPFYSTT